MSHSFYVTYNSFKGRARSRHHVHPTHYPPGRRVHIPERVPSEGVSPERQASARKHVWCIHYVQRQHGAAQLYCQGGQVQPHPARYGEHGVVPQVNKRTNS